MGKAVTCVLYLLGVHGPGPEKGFMDPWSMFCPYPSNHAYEHCGFVFTGVGHSLSKRNWSDYKLSLIHI